MSVYLTAWAHIFSPPYLVSCGHNSHHREFLDLHLRDSHSGQETDLRRAHVGPFCKHALPALDIMTDRPVVGGGREDEEKRK